MDDNAELPMRPALFLPLYLMFLIAGTVVQPWRHPSQILFLSALGLHLFWVLSAASFAAEARAHVPENSWVPGRLQMLRGLVFCFGVVLLVIFGNDALNDYLRPGIHTAASPVAPVLFVGASLAVFAFFFLAGKTLVQVEARPSAYDQTTLAVGYAFMFATPFAASYIYGRLEKLKAV